MSVGHMNRNLRDTWPKGGWESYEQEECYEFNEALEERLDDGECQHCAHYLTDRCKKLDEFLDDLDDI